MGKVMIIIGLLFLTLGIIIHYSGKIPFMGKLPGDIVIEREDYKLYIPITSCILASILISFILYLMGKLKD